MKSKIYIAVLILLSFVITGNSYSGDPEDLKTGYDFNLISKDKLTADYPKMKKQYDIKAGKPIDIYMDFQLGIGTTSANISNAMTSASYESSSKLGATLGGLLHINLFDVISFTSGISFEGKSFKFTPPATDTAAINQFGAGEKSISNTYMNIPLNFNVGGMVSEKVGITFCGGPYLGIRLNNDNLDGFGYKNFDLGLNGTLTVNYVVMYPFSIIAGTKFEFGGLNKLGSTRFIESITTQNFTFFSGGRIWF